jgi:hypothetical protein
MALSLMVLLSAIGASLVLLTRTDTAIATNVGASIEAFYAAEAAFELTLAEVRTVANLSSVLDGTTGSAFVDGPAGGSRQLAGGISVDLSQVMSLASCQKPTTCSEADLVSTTRDRPWGSRNPRWRLFVHGELGRLTTASNSPSIYVVSMVADDPAETDGDPWRDGARTGSSWNPGAGRLLVRAEAFGRRAAHRVVEGAVLRQDLAAQARWEAADPATRGDPPGGVPLLQVVTWRDRR